MIILLIADSYQSAKIGIEMLFNARIIGMVAAPVLIFIINGILPANVKANFVFWRIKDPLPGSRAFSKHGKNDPRIDFQVLQLIHGPLPVSPKDQNILWYKIYRKHQSEVTILKSHKDYLLARDMTSIAILFFIFTGIPALFLSKWPFNLYYVCIQLLVVTLISIVGQNYGKRFVTNVLAVESGI